MAVQPYIIDAANAGSVAENAPEATLPKGFVSVCRNIEIRASAFRARRVWQKVNVTAPSGVTRWLRLFSYCDTRDTRHVLALGDNGSLYHDTDDFAAPVASHDLVIWDETAEPTGGPWRDDFLLALGGTDGVGKNLRYRGRHGDLVGVSLDAPTTAPTVEAGTPISAGGVPAGEHDFLVTFLDVTDADYGEEFESDGGPSCSITTTENGTLDFSAIPICIQAGRDIWRRFYRSDGGGTWVWAFDIENNADETYAGYSDEEASDTPYHARPPVPMCRCVSMNPNGVAQWGHDVPNNRRASMYPALDDLNPEAVAVDASDMLIEVPIGTPDDPLISQVPARDGTFCLKRDSVYYTPRQCTDLCERRVKAIGTVSDNGQTLGNRLVWLSPLGIIMTDSEDKDMPWRFVGPDPRVFALSSTWAEVQTDKLSRARGFHSPEANIMGWLVQRHAGGTHNDTLIVWDYGRPSPVTGGSRGAGGELRAWDFLCDDIVRVKNADGDGYELWGAFPLGYIGRLLDAEPDEAGDGCASLIQGTVVDSEVNEDGTTNVYVDDSEWTEDGDGVRGCVFYVRKGTGSRRGLAAQVGDNAKCLITSHNEAKPSGYDGPTLPAGATNCIVLAGEVALDATSEFWIGGFKPHLRWPVALGHLEQNRQFVRAYVEVTS